MLTPVQRLKIALFAEGLVASPAARRQICGDGTRPKPLTLADYASTSGLSLELEGGVWVNAPIEDFNPNFVKSPRHRLELEDGEFWVVSEDLRVRAKPAPVPSYFDETNSWGERYTSFAITHTDRVRISPIEGCAIACQFCDLPYRYRYRSKSVAALVDSVARAEADPDLPARHVLISGGTPRQQDYGYLNQVYEAVASSFPHLPLDVMMVPMPGLLDPKQLHALGIHGLSINLEMHDVLDSRRIMPAKAKLGSQYFLDFIAKAAEIFAPGCVRSLLLVGLEPMRETLKAVEALAERGCDPVLSPFRPDPHTPLRAALPPSEVFLAEVYERAVEIVERHGVKLGPRCIPCQHNTLTFPDESPASATPS